MSIVEMKNVRVALMQTSRGLEDRLIAGCDAVSGARDRSTSADHLLLMTQQLLHHWGDWPVDKIARWVGFIQGVMAARGWLSVEEERDRTRPLFHEAYEADGIPVPESVSVGEAIKVEK